MCLKLFYTGYRIALIDNGLLQGIVGNRFFQSYHCGSCGVADLGRLYAVERFKSLFYVHLAMIAHHTVDLNGLFHLFCLLFTCCF